MNSEWNETAGREWRPASAYMMAVFCLVLGGMVGYLLRGSTVPAPAIAAHSGENLTASTATIPQTPSLDDMKHMADKQAEPVLGKLKGDPKNPELLIQVGAIYQATHRFKEAAEYYEQSLEIKPGNVGIRTQAATCLYYAGDINGALSELQRSLQDDPRNANALFNLGVIKWRGKQDGRGALKAWQKLLDSNPKLEAQKKADVRKLMTQVRQQSQAGFASGNQFSKE
ncbi:MAG: hypothetical protein DMG68_12380 [Acidobacteria bacterium]|nr:MAG: hypothetical protein DMG68_12380 [Acidobacteriota bacterium]